MNEIEKYNSSIGNLIEPESISYSFNTPGWYLVFGLILLAVIIVAFIQFRKYKKNEYRRQAISEIDKIKQIENRTESILELNSLLKIVAIQIYGRTKVAALYGKQWFGFMATSINKTESIPTNNFDDFAKALYNKDFFLNDNQYNSLVTIAILWIKNHKKADV